MVYLNVEWKYGIMERKSKKKPTAKARNSNLLMKADWENKKLCERNNQEESCDWCHDFFREHRIDTSQTYAFVVYGGFFKLLIWIDRVL